MSRAVTLRAARTNGADATETSAPLKRLTPARKINLSCPEDTGASQEPRRFESGKSQKTRAKEFHWRPVTTNPSPME